MIVKIDGCTASGKSTLVKHLLKRFAGVKEIYDGRAGMAEAYEGSYGSKTIIVLGDYGPIPLSGGMDTFGTHERRCAAIKKYANECNVLIFDGVLNDKLFSPATFGTNPEDWVYVFVELSPEECQRRMKARRAARGMTPMGDSLKRFRNECATVANRKKRRLAAGDKVFTVDSMNTSGYNAENLLSYLGGIL